MYQTGQDEHSSEDVALRFALSEAILQAKTEAMLPKRARSYHLRFFPFTFYIRFVSDESDTLHLRGVGIFACGETGYLVEDLE